jgi:hypothetical protein
MLHHQRANIQITNSCYVNCVWLYKTKKRGLLTHAFFVAPFGISTELNQYVKEQNKDLAFLQHFYKLNAQRICKAFINLQRVWQTTCPARLVTATGGFTTGTNYQLYPSTPVVGHLLGINLMIPEVPNIAGV